MRFFACLFISLFALSAKGKPRVLFIGDSFTEHNHLLKKYGDVWAQSGRQTEWMKKTVKRKKNRLNRYDTVVLLGGINDIYSAKGPEKVKKNIDFIVSFAEGYGAKVVLCTIPQTDIKTIHKRLTKRWKKKNWDNGIYPYSPSELKVHFNEVNAHIRSFKKKNQDILVIDLHLIMGEYSDTYFVRGRDRLHPKPGKEGFDRMGTVIAGHLGLL